MLIAYLDTCIVSGLAKRDLADEELQALRQILEAYKKGTLSLVTSIITKQEIEKIPKTYRIKHEDVYNLLAEVPVAPAFRRDRVFSLLPWNLGVRLQSMLAQLTTVLPDDADARHIYQAAQNAAQYFITTDSKTILSHRVLIEQIAKVKTVSPIEFLHHVAIEAT